MIPEEIGPPDAVPSVKSEEAEPKDSPQEDRDTARGEAFKRMFPGVPRKAPDRSKKPSD
jgi:hypothetical protein